MLNVFPVFLLPIARFDEPVSCTTHTGYFCRIVLYCVVVIVAGIAGYERLYPDSIYLRDDDDDLNRITIASEKMIKEFLILLATSKPQVKNICKCNVPDVAHCISTPLSTPHTTKQ